MRPDKRDCAPLAMGCLLTFAGAGAMLWSERLGDEAELAVRIAALAVLSLAFVVVVHAMHHAALPRRRMTFGAAALGIAALAAMFVYASYADMSVEMASLLPSTDTGPDTTIQLGSGGTDVRLSGDLTDGAADRLDALLEAHPGVTRVHLTSDGGLADQGKAIADVIAAHKLATFVPDYCVSACTLAFLGGRERFVTADARLGFHAPYEEGLFGQTFEDKSSAAREDYLAAGVAPGFVDRALRVASSDIWFPAADQLIAAHVATEVVDRYRFPDSSLDGSATNDGARSMILHRFPVMRAFAARSAHALDQLAAWYLAAYRRGRSEGDIADRLKAIIASAVVVSLARADDATLVRAARYLLVAERAAARGTPADCMRIGETADIVAAQRLLDRGSLDDTSETRRRDEGTALVEAALAGERHAMPTATQTSLIASADLRTATARTVCEDVADAYEDLLGGTTAEIAAALRAVLAAQVPRAIATAAAIARERP